MVRYSVLRYEMLMIDIDRTPFLIIIDFDHPFTYFYIILLENRHYLKCKQ